MRHVIKQTSHNHHLKAYKPLSEHLQVTIFVYCFLPKLTVACTLNVLLYAKLNVFFNKIGINHRDPNSNISKPLVYGRMVRITIRFVMNTVLYH